MGILSLRFVIPNVLTECKMMTSQLLIKLIQLILPSQVVRQVFLHLYRGSSNESVVHL